jgi:hypothetical protein
MQSLLVIDLLEELLDGCLGFLEITVLRAVDFLVFQGLKESLRQALSYTFPRRLMLI